MRNVLLVTRRELSAHARSLLAWSLPVALLLMLTLSLQPSMSGDGGLLAAKLAAMPEGMRKALNFQVVDLARPAGYLATNFLYVALTSALFAGLLGATLVSKEETFRTAEFLLTLPISRTQVLLGKALAAVLLIAAFEGLLAGAALLSLRAFVSASFEAPLVLQLFGGALLLGLCFGGVGLLVATAVRGPRHAPSVTLGVVFGAYFLGMASRTAETLEWMRWVSPFQYVEAADIVQSGALGASALLLPGAAVAATALALARFIRKDIHA